MLVHSQQEKSSKFLCWFKTGICWFSVGSLFEINPLKINRYKSLNQLNQLNQHLNYACEIKLFFWLVAFVWNEVEDVNANLSATNAR